MSYILPTIVGDILDPECPIDVTIHQANIQCTFGAGLAAQIKAKYPEVYAADRATKRGDLGKLGTFSHVAVDICDSVSGAFLKRKHFVNLYSQAEMGGQDRQTSYDAMARGLELLEQEMENWYQSSADALFTIGIPYRLGSGLANGNFSIVESIVAESLPTYAVEKKVWVIRRPQDF